jgi:UDP-N-acetyl-D-galactosamine dehydrogenase
LISELDINKYAGVIVAVGHNEFKNLDFLLMRKNGTVVFDVKGILKRELVDDRL